MYCPRCGKSEQQEKSFCRQCGVFLPGLDEIKGKVISPEQHFSANTTLNMMSAVVSLASAITLYVMFLGKEGTPVVIYVTAGFLTAMFFWQAQVLWRTYQLKKQFPGLNRKNEKQDVEETSDVESKQTNELLNEADFRDVVPPSIVEETTKQLTEVPKHRSH
jgi:hypothetical protein